MQTERGTETREHRDRETEIHKDGDIPDKRTNTQFENCIKIENQPLRCIFRIGEASAPADEWLRSRKSLEIEGNVNELLELNSSLNINMLIDNESSSLIPRNSERSLVVGPYPNILVTNNVELDLNLIWFNSPFFDWSSVLAKLSHHADRYEEFEGCLEYRSLPSQGTNVDSTVIPIFTGPGFMCNGHR